MSKFSSGTTGNWSLLGTRESASKKQKHCSWEREGMIALQDCFHRFQILHIRSLTHVWKSLFGAAGRSPLHIQFQSHFLKKLCTPEQKWPKNRRYTPSPNRGRSCFCSWSVSRSLARTGDDRNVGIPCCGHIIMAGHETTYSLICGLTNCPFQRKTSTM